MVELEGFKSTAPGFDPGCGDQFHGGRADEDALVPPVSGELAGGVDRVSGTGGDAATAIDLQGVPGDRGDFI